LRVVELVGVPGAVFDFEPRSHSRLAQEVASAIGIMLIPSHRTVIPDQSGWQQPLGDDAESAENHVVDSLPVDGVVHRLPHFDPVARWRRAAVADVASITLDLLEEVRGVLRIETDLPDDVQGNAVRDVELAA